MKKFSIAVLSAILVCAFAAGLSGCKQTKLNGKYYLENGGAQNGGPVYQLMQQNEQGFYENINGGFIVSEKFWVEINGKKMTVHGSITPTVTERDIKFNVNEAYVREFTFTLKESESNHNWYDIYSEGEDTLYSVYKSGTDVTFYFGTPGDLTEYYYTFNYTKK